MEVLFLCDVNKILDEILKNNQDKIVSYKNQKIENLNNGLLEKESEKTATSETDVEKTTSQNAPQSILNS